MQEEKRNGKAKGNRGSRRQARARRQDVFRQWRDGNLNEDGHRLERHSREGSSTRPVTETFLETEGETRRALVLESHRRTCKVRSKEDIFDCRHQGLRDSDGTRIRAVVGDHICCAGLKGGGDWVVTAIEERSSRLSRPGPKDRVHRELVLAANVDRVVVVATAAQPDFNAGFVDRFLVAVQFSGIDAILAVNKMDLVSTLPAESEWYLDQGVQVLPVSAADGTGIQKLQELLSRGVSVLSGQSGVGKSTLINRLLPRADLETSLVRERDGKGRHTTISSVLLELPSGGQVIDTPGLRELGLWNLPPEELGSCFAGFDELQYSCRFADCKHLHEPDCAVKAAVEEGRLPEGRYRSYHRILESL